MASAGSETQSVRRPRTTGPLSFLTADLQSKLLALVFAALTWVWINREITDTVEFVLPVTVECQARGVIVVDVRPRRERFVLVGPKDKLAGLEAADLTKPFIITPDDQPLAADQQETTLSRAATDFVKLPSGVTLERSPEISVRLVRSAERSVRLSPTIVGEPAEGYVVERVELDPNEVAVQAPTALLDRLRELPTAAIDVSGRTAADSPISTSVAIPRVLDGTPIAPLDAGRVRVKVFIARKVVAKQLRLTKKTIYLSAPAGFPFRVAKVEPDAVDVWVVGPSDDEAAVANLRVYVELDSEDPAVLASHHKNIHYPLRVRGLPSGYRLLKFEIRTGDTVREVEKVRVSMEKK